MGLFDLLMSDDGLDKVYNSFEKKLDAVVTKAENFAENTDKLGEKLVAVADKTEEALAKVDKKVQ
jgi:hypothetical protein